jgi:pectinesterase
LSIHAQLKIGLTGKPDTSYSIYSAYLGTKKEFPDIRIVGEFKFNNVSEKKNIIYCDTGKRELLLDAFYPNTKSNTKRTAIIIIHGGGWRTGNRTQHYPLAQSLANLGYVAFTPEYGFQPKPFSPRVYMISNPLYGG